MTDPYLDKKELVKEFRYFENQRTEEYIQNRGKKEETPEEIIQRELDLNIGNDLFHTIEVPDIWDPDTGIIRSGRKVSILEKKHLNNDPRKMYNNSLEQGIPLKCLEISDLRFYPKTEHLYAHGIPRNHSSGWPLKHYEDWYLIEQPELLASLKQDIERKIKDNLDILHEQFEEEMVMWPEGKEGLIPKPELGPAISINKDVNLDCFFYLLNHQTA